jgi:aminopeptidase N
MNARRIVMPILAVVAAAGCGRDAGDGTETPVDLWTTAMTEPGVSLPLARHRAATLRDVRYELDLDVMDSTRAPGRVTVAFQRSGVGDLVLDFRGISVDSGTANGQSFAPEWRDGHIIVPAELLGPGENTVSLPFVSAIAPAGASIIRYDDATDGSRYLYTLLVPSDAQMLFPAFDQPDLKAKLTFALTVPADWQVLANGPEAGRSPAGDGATRWTFAETRPLSTYLMAFAAGPWAVLRGDARGAPAVASPADAAEQNAAAADSTQATAAGNGSVARAMRLFVRKSRAREVDADTLLRLTRDGLARLEGYFDLPYPFAKLDILLAPAFPFGGMEHVGAIFFNESSFIFREPPTLTRRLGRMNTINHELAHQWFGDLVTMKWFDDLWLKEGFATYMAAKMQDALSPDANAWKTFYLRNKPSAYAVDATTGTTPVWQELSNLDQAKSNYGPIVYTTGQGTAILEDVAKDQKEIAVVEQAPRMEGRLMFMILAPTPKVAQKARELARQAAGGAKRPQSAGKPEPASAPEAAASAPEAAASAPKAAVSAPEAAVSAPEAAVSAPEAAVSAPEAAVKDEPGVAS